MKLFALLLLPSFMYAAAPKQPSFKYTPELLKALKPPLVAQQYTLKSKAQTPCHKPHPPLVAVPEMRSPRKKYRRLRVPNNSIDLGNHKAQIVPPFPEVVIKFEALK